MNLKPDVGDLTKPAETIAQAIARMDNCFELAGECIAQQDWLRVRTAVEAKDLQLECLNLVLAAVSAKAGVDSKDLVAMLRHAEEELRAKRWLS